MHSPAREDKWVSGDLSPLEAPDRSDTGAITIEKQLALAHENSELNRTSTHEGRKAMLQMQSRSSLIPEHCWDRANALETSSERCIRFRDEFQALNIPKHATMRAVLQNRIAGQTCLKGGQMTSQRSFGSLTKWMMESPTKIDADTSALTGIFHNLVSTFGLSAQDQHSRKAEKISETPASPSSESILEQKNSSPKAVAHFHRDGITETFRRQAIVSFPEQKRHSASASRLFSESKPPSPGSSKSDGGSNANVVVVLPSDSPLVGQHSSLRASSREGDRTLVQLSPMQTANLPKLWSF